MNRIYVLLIAVVGLTLAFLAVGLYVNWEQMIIQVIIQVIVQSILWGGLWRRIRQHQTTTPTTIPVRINQDLSPVDAAVLLDYTQSQVMKMIIYMLIKKDVVRLIENRPQLKLERTGVQTLKYFEDELLRSMRADGTLDNSAFPRIYENIRHEVGAKMAGYTIEATKNHYRDRVRQKMEIIETSNIQLEE